MKTHEDTDRHPTDLKSARMNYPNSTMQPFVLQNASVGFQYPKPALSYIEKPYEYKLHDKYLTKKKTLINHQRVHTGKSAYL